MVVALSTLTTACSSSASSTSSTTATETPSTPPGSASETGSAGCRAPAAPEPARSEHVEVALTSSDLDRTYLEYVPAGDAEGPAPLVVDLHGYLSGAAGQVAMSDLGTFAETAGVVVATPQGNGAHSHWNAVPHDELPDDVQFVADVIDDVSSRRCIDPARVYVQGFSNGAFLTSLVACELADRVAAVAAVAGLLFPDGCEPARPIPILTIHGTDDQFVTFDGSPNVALSSLPWDEQSTLAFTDLPFAPVRDSLGEWAAVEGCASPPDEQPVTGSVARVRYGGCLDDSTLELYVVDGGGHAWPGSEFSAASAAIVGPTTTEIDATELIWEFFADHPMPGAAS